MYCDLFSGIAMVCFAAGVPQFVLPLETQPFSRLQLAVVPVNVSSTGEDHIVITWSRHSRYEGEGERSPRRRFVFRVM